MKDDLFGWVVLGAELERNNSQKEEYIYVGMGMGILGR